MFMFIRSKPLQIQHSPVKLHSVLNAITARWATACPLWTAFSDFKFLNGIEFTTALCLLLQNYLIFFVIHSWNSSTLSVFFLFPTISHTLMLLSFFHLWMRSADSSLKWLFLSIYFVRYFFPLLSGPPFLCPDISLSWFANKTKWKKSPTNPRN